MYTHVTFCYLFIDTCVLYSIQACETAANHLNKRTGGGGHNFIEDASAGYEYGCYGYNSGKYSGIIFYGSGGTTDQMKTSLNYPKYRPKGYDCSTEGKKLYIICNEWDKANG